MNILFKSSVLCASVLLAACNNDDHQQSQTTPENNTSSKYYQTKTPYQPLQDLKKYEPTPQGFEPVFTELVARHGSRGLSSIKYDLALYNLWKQAKAENALTPLGEKLGADLESMMKANIICIAYCIKAIISPTCNSPASILWPPTQTIKTDTPFINSIMTGNMIDIARFTNI